MTRNIVFTLVSKYTTARSHRNESKYQWCASDSIYVDLLQAYGLTIPQVALVLRSLGNLRWRHWLSRALSLPVSRDPGFGIRHSTLGRLVLSAQSCPARYQGTPNAIISRRQYNIPELQSQGRTATVVCPSQCCLRAKGDHFSTL